MIIIINFCLLLLYIEYSCYLYDFDGRSLVNDNNNFQLVHNQLYYDGVKNISKYYNDDDSKDKNKLKDNKQVVFRFGKRTEYSYCLDFTYPLSPISAFAIALSSLGKDFNV